MVTETTAATPAPKKRLRPLAYDLLMFYVLVIATFLRLAGIYWGEFQYLHPAERFYDRRGGGLGGDFAAVAVLQIQQSHFFTVDTFLNFFIVLSFYFAIR